MAHFCVSIGHIIPPFSVPILKMMKQSWAFNVSNELRDARPDASLKMIADILNSEGYTTKEGKQFHAMQVKRILDRKAFYEGTYRYSGIDADGKHHPIL